MGHIVNSCPLTQISGGLTRLHEGGDDAVNWLTTTAATVLGKMKLMCHNGVTRLVQMQLWNVTACVVLTWVFTDTWWWWHWTMSGHWTFCRI